MAKRAIYMEDELDTDLIGPFLPTPGTRARIRPPHPDDFGPPGFADDLAEARVGVEQWLDAFQAVLGARWRWLLRLSASGLAAVIAGMALVVFPLSLPQSVGVLIASFVFGGFFAGLWRDLASLAERRPT